MLITIRLQIKFDSNAKLCKYSNTWDFPAPNSPSMTMPLGQIPAVTLCWVASSSRRNLPSISGCKQPNAFTTCRFGTPARSPSITRRASKSGTTCWESIGIVFDSCCDNALDPDPILTNKDKGFCLCLGRISSHTRSLSAS